MAALSAALAGTAGLARLRRLGGMYGQFTFETKQGARTLAFERGTIASVTRGDVVVRAQDGTTWVWDLTGTSVVRDDGKRSTETALATGKLVFAGGPVAGGRGRPADRDQKGRVRHRVAARRGSPGHRRARRRRRQSAGPRP